MNGRDFLTIAIALECDWLSRAERWLAREWENNKKVSLNWNRTIMSAWETGKIVALRVVVVVFANLWFLAWHSSWKGYALVWPNGPASTVIYTEVKPIESNILHWRSTFGTSAICFHSNVAMKLIRAQALEQVLNICPSGCFPDVNYMLHVPVSQTGEKYSVLHHGANNIVFLGGRDG